MINPAGRESRGVGVGLDRSDEIPDPRGQYGGDEGEGRGAIDTPAAPLQSAEEGGGGDRLLPVQHNSATPLPGAEDVDNASLPFANYGGGDGNSEGDGEFVFQPFFHAPELTTVGEHWRDTLNRQLPPTTASPTTASSSTGSPTISAPTPGPQTIIAQTAAPRLSASPPGTSQPTGTSQPSTSQASIPQASTSQASTSQASTSQASTLQPGISQFAATQSATPQTFTYEATAPPSAVSRISVGPSGAHNVLPTTQSPAVSPPPAISQPPATSQTPATSGASLISAGAQFPTDSATSSLLSPARSPASSRPDAAAPFTTNANHVVPRGNAPQTSTPPLTAYLLGGDAGTDLSPETRIALSLLGEVLGEDGINVLASHIKAGDSAHSRLLEAALNYALRDVGRESAAAPTQTATLIAPAHLAPAHIAPAHLTPAHIAPTHIAPTHIAPALTASMLDVPAPVAPHAPTKRTHIPRVVSELVAAVRLGAHFDDLEKFGGAIVRQAENSLRGFLTRAAADARAGVALTELVRDLRSGAFLSTTGTLAQFPLTGRARVASEMMALMRALHHIERVLSRAADAQPMAVTVLTPRLERPLSRDARAAPVLDSLHSHAAVAPRPPRLPGCAGRFEIDNFMRTLFGGGAAAAQQGGAPPELPTLPVLPTLPDLPTLRAGDGTPLKPRELLWLGVAGGLLANSDGEASLATLAPALAHGFDALYSLIGFDGRSPLAPAFLLVQSEINYAKPDAMFGRMPFTVGWTRALIERLKDSAVAAHNRLGEQLEVALADDCLHSFVLRGAVEDGTPVAGSFALSAVATPATSTALRPAFA